MNPLPVRVVRVRRRQNQDWVVAYNDHGFVGFLIVESGQGYLLAHRLLGGDGSQPRSEIVGSDGSALVWLGTGPAPDVLLIDL